MVFSSRPSVKVSFKTIAMTIGLSSLAITGVILGLRQVGFFEQAELQKYDELLRLRPNKAVDQRVVVIGIGEKDIQTRQEYPVKDDTLAELLQKLEQYEPSVIGVDIGRDVPQGTAKGRKEMLAEIQKNDRIIMACVLSSSKDAGVPAPKNTPTDQIASADFPIDRDSTVRRAALISAPADNRMKLGETHICNDTKSGNEVPSLAFSTAINYLFDRKIEPEVSQDKQSIRLGATTLKRLPNSIGSYINADAPDFQVLINYRGSKNAVQSIEMGDVLSGNVDPTLLKDKLVLIGYTSPIAHDMLKTPYVETEAGMREMYGINIHAQVASHLLGAAMDGQQTLTAWSDGIEILYIFLWSLAGGTIAFYCRRLLLLILAAGGSFVLCWGLAYGLMMQGVWIPLVPTSWALVSGMLVAGTIDRMNRSGYAQALYEQMTMQIAQAQVSDRQEDYMTGLVRRARIIRAQRDGVELQEDKAMAIGQSILEAKFDTPEAQELFEQLRQKWEQEHRSTLMAATQQRQADSQNQRVSRLLDRARSARNQPAIPPMTIPQAVRKPITTGEETPIIHPDWAENFEKSGVEVKV
jgi:adenylate cyclase